MPLFWNQFAQWQEESVLIKKIPNRYYFIPNRYISRLILHQGLTIIALTNWSNTLRYIVHQETLFNMIALTIHKDSSPPNNLQTGILPNIHLRLLTTSWYGIRRIRSRKPFKHDIHQGKGAAIHTGIAQATGDYLLAKDADLEYDPGEYSTL